MIAVTAHREESRSLRVYMRNEKKRVLKELLDQNNPHGHAHKRFQNSFKNEMFFSHKTHALLHTALRQTTTTLITLSLSLSLSLSLFKKGILPALNAKEGNLCLEYYICARALERMCGLKDLKKNFFFPLLRVKGAEAQKNTFRVTVIFFLVSLPKNFWSSALPHFGKKKHKKKRHETRTVNQSFRLCCCSRAKKRRDVL